MRKNLLPRLVPFLGLVIVAVTARAGTLNEWGRYLGWGYSDGYHARPAGPPSRTDFIPFMPSTAPSFPQAPCVNCHPQAYGGPFASEAPPVARSASQAPVKSGRLPALPSRQAQPRVVPLQR